MSYRKYRGWIQIDYANADSIRLEVTFDPDAFAYYVDLPYEEAIGVTQTTLEVLECATYRSRRFPPHPRDLSFLHGDTGDIITLSHVLDILS